MSQADREELQPGQSECMWCGGVLEPDGHCVDCGRVETRVCACGQELMPGEDRCPSCGTEWKGVVRVRRRKKHRRFQAFQALKYVGVGVFIALVAAAILNSVVGGLAVRNRNYRGTELPSDPAERAALAWETVTETFTAMNEATAERLRAILVFVILGLLGAVLGVVFYMRHEGVAVFGRGEDRSPNASRRRRRV